MRIISVKYLCSKKTVLSRDYPSNVPAIRKKAEINHVYATFRLTMATLLVLKHYVVLVLSCQITTKTIYHF